MTCLIVDDELATREYLKGVGDWQTYGFDRVLDCDNGRIAEDILQRESIDLVLLDMKMPRIDGVDILDWIEGHGRHPMIVVISGYEDFTYTQKAIRSRVLDYLLKPVDRLDLHRCLCAAAAALKSRPSSSNSGGTAEEPVGTVVAPDRGDCGKAGTDLLSQIVGYLRKNYARQITLEDLSKDFLVSREHICRLFQSEMNTTFGKFLAWIRVERAKVLLATQSFTLQSIAAEVGYSDERYFSRVFHKTTGMSPISYRHRTA